MTAFSWALAVAVLATAPGKGNATATVDAHITGVTCTVTNAAGEITTQPCDVSGWSTTLLDGWSADMTATLSYAYHDDGLSLGWDGMSSRRAWFYLGHNGSPILFPDFESAAIYIDTYPTLNGCFSRYPLCADRYLNGVQFTGHQTYPPIFLWNNDFADDLSGRLVVTTGARYDPGPSAPLPNWTTTLSMDVRTQVFSVAAVPELSTWALMVGPLLGLVLFARRRHKILS